MGAAEDHYATMTTDALCDLGPEVAGCAADRAHLYLWSTGVHLPDALRVMSAWGFEYVTYLVWAKQPASRLGLGYYFRSVTELVLFGRRGRLRTQDRTLPNLFSAPRGRHGAKPATFLDLVQRASPGPYLELFARCSGPGCDCSACRLGWDSWG